MRLPDGRLPLWARAADLIAIALLLLAAGVAVKGGFAVSLAGVLLSVKSEWRIVVWAVGLLAARHLILKSPPFYSWIVSDVVALAHAAGSLPADPIFFEERRSLLWRLAAAIGIVALYVALTIVMMYPQVIRLGTAVSFDEGDALFSVWRLAWIAHQISRDPLRLFDANIFYPDTHALAYSDAVLVPGLTAAPLLWLGVHQLKVYNIVFLSAFVLSGAGMFLLVRSLTRNAAAALVAGFVFAFLPFRYMHYAHLEMQMAQWMPLALWAFHRTVKSGRVRDGLLTGLFLALQTLSSWYYGLFLVTYLVPVGLVLIVAEGRAAFGSSVKALAAGAVLSSALALPMAMPYFAARQSVGERELTEIKFYSATPTNYLAAHPRNSLYGRWTAKWGGQERELFLGFVVPLLALVGVWPPLSRARLAYVIGAALAFEISLGYNGFVYPWLHEFVFPYRGLRVPARMAILVGFSLAVLSGFGVARIWQAMPTRRLATAASLIAASLVFIEYRVTLPLKYIDLAPPPIYARIPEASPAVLLELPLIKPDIALEPYYMYFSTFHWNRLVNGYSGFNPPQYLQLVDSIDNFPDDDTITELRQRGVDYVVVHGGFYSEEERYAEIVSRIEQRPEFELVATEQWKEREGRLYRFLRRSTPRVADHR